MDPATLVSTAMAVLTPFVKKGVAEFGRAAGQAACDKAQQLLDFIRSKVAGDKTASDNLETFEKKPEIYKTVIEDTLTEKVAADAGFAAELEKRLAEMEPQLIIIQEIDKGKRSTGLKAEEMTSGTVKVTQKIRESEDATGAHIGRIGRAG